MSIMQNLNNVGNIELLNGDPPRSRSGPFDKNLEQSRSVNGTTSYQHTRLGAPLNVNHATFDGKVFLKESGMLSVINYDSEEVQFSHQEIGNASGSGIADRNMESQYDAKVLKEKKAVSKLPEPNMLRGLLSKTKVKRDRKVLHPQAKEIILNVVNFMKQEAGGVFEIPAKKVQCRAAKATGFSERTVRRVVKESKTLPVVENPNGGGSSVSFPPKKVPNRPKPKTGLDSLTRCAIRRIIHRIYVNEKMVPTIKKIHQQLVEEIGFKGGSRSAHKIVKEMGFYWKKTKAKNYILMERHDIRLKRIEYLRDIKKLRHEGRLIVYVADATLSGGRGSIESISALTAGSARGFFLLGPLFSVGHQSDLTPSIANWARDSLMPAIPPNTVIVLDGAACTSNSGHERIPTVDSDTETMRSWLNSKGISFRPDMLRPELHQIIRRNAARFRKQKNPLEKILTDAGHTVLRIPPDHPDLNPVALMWADVRHAVAESSGTARATAEDIRALAERRLSEVGADAWASRCAHVRTVEQQYLASEGIVDAEVERLLAASKEVAHVQEECEDPQDNNINFVRHFMGGLLGLDEQKLYNG